MPKRQTQFILGGTYHILNRGVNKMPIFLSKADYKRFEELVAYYRFDRKVCYSGYRKNRAAYDLKYPDPKLLLSILTYCIMPNHFHIQVQLTSDKGARDFTRKLLGSYAMYFNKKYQRVGPVFQNRFVSVPMKSTDQFLYLSAYIHRNPLEAGIVSSPEALLAYPYSSLSHYGRFTHSSFVNEKPVLSYFKNTKDYFDFVFRTGK
jgi:putative transposase